MRAKLNRKRKKKKITNKLIETHMRHGMCCCCLFLVPYLSDCYDFRAFKS